MRCIAPLAVWMAACTVGESRPFPGGTGVSGSAGEAGSDGVGDSVGESVGESVGDSDGDSVSVGDTTTAAHDTTSTETSGSPDGDPLDPDLDIPSDGEPCTSPGDLQECPGIAVCRFATTEHGLCESCEPCGNLNAPCNASSECDILFSCYAGRCTNFCTLGTFECGPVEDCLDVGHATMGVCDPFA